MRVSSFLIVGLLVCIVLFLFLGHFCFVLCCVCGCLKHPPLRHFEAAQFYTYISIYIFVALLLSFFFWITFFLLYVIYCYCKTLTLCFGWFAGLHDRLHRRRAPCLRASPREFSDLDPACALLVERRSASANAAGVTLGCECEERSGTLQELLWRRPSPMKS